MNRLNSQRVYLAGAMDRVPDRGTTWRDNITPFLQKLGIEVFNPISKPSNIGLEDCDVHAIKAKLKAKENYDELSSMMKTIRAVDLRLVDISDFLIVNMNLDIHPCGTYEEIFWANRQKKPIIIHMEQGKKYAPDWLFGTIPHQTIFSTWDEIKDYLVHIDSSENIDTHKRWYFFTINSCLNTMSNLDKSNI
jgi:nucleoside 2-deoxyribosyltransferase